MEHTAQVSLPDIKKKLTQDKKKTPIRYWRALLALFIVVIPSLAAIFYYSFIASNQYVTEIRFAVRSQETSRADALGAATGMPANMLSLASDSYIVVNYILSRQAVDEMDQALNLRKIYGATSIDWFSRFNNDNQVEYLVDYWKGQVAANFDITSGLIIVKVKAFTPQDSKDIADNLLKQTENLVNQLSENARIEVMKGTTEDVKRAELRLKEIRSALKNFRDQETVADPVKSAGTKQEMIARVQGDLAQLRAEIASSKPFLREDSPSILVLRSREKAIQAQLKTLNSELVGESTLKDKTVSSMLASYDEVDVERQIAEKNYSSALASYERARGEADRKQRYLATFVKPSLAEYPLYPRRIEMILIIIALSVMLWAIFTFVIQAIKDHIH